MSKRRRKRSRGETRQTNQGEGQKTIFPQSHLACTARRGPWRGPGRRRGRPHAANPTKERAREAGGLLLPSPQATSSNSFFSLDNDVGKKSAIPGLFPFPALPPCSTSSEECPRSQVARAERERTQLSKKKLAVEKGKKTQRWDSRETRCLFSQQPPLSFSNPSSCQRLLLSAFTSTRRTRHWEVAHAGEDIASRRESVGGAKEKSREARLGPLFGDGRKRKVEISGVVSLALSLSCPRSTLSTPTPQPSSIFSFSIYNNENSTIGFFSRPPRSLRR